MGLGSGKNQVVTDYNHLVRCVSSNTGNLLFNFAVENIIHFTQADIRWAHPAEEINREKTPLLLPMANNIGPHMDVLKSGPRLEGVNVHKTVMGLGAQFPLAITDPKIAAEKVPAGTKQWLDTLVSDSNVANISVRGAFTKQVLAELGIEQYVVPLGCPSHFINPNPRLGELLAAKSEALSYGLPNGIAIAAGNPGIKNLNALERFLIGLIDEFSGKYIVQHPKSLICLSQLWKDAIEPEELNAVNRDYFPNKTPEEMLSWFAKNSTTYVSVPQWFMDISKYSMCLGTRIHGVQAAIQSGVPAVCLYIDSRTKELCETMQIPKISAHEFQRQPSLEHVINTLKKWDWESYENNRLRLAKETEAFIRDNGLTGKRKHIL